jgi:hypothetical protein
MRRNFTTFILDWKKPHKLGRLLNDKWINHYKSLIGKFIKEKYNFKDYYLEHLPNTAAHMLGDHSLCDADFYCDDEHRSEFKKINISTEARNALNSYLR